LKQWLDFEFQEKIEARDRLGIIQKDKMVETTIRFPVEGNIKSMDSMAIIEGLKNSLNNGYIKHFKKRLKVWLD